MVLFLLFVLAVLIGAAVYLSALKKRKPMLPAVQPPTPQKLQTTPMFSRTPSFSPRPPATPPVPPPIPPRPPVPPVPPVPPAPPAM